MIIIIIIIIISFKDTIQGFLQSPHCAAKRLQQYAQVARAQSCNTWTAYHVQHVVLCAKWYEGQLSYEVWESWNRIYLSFILFAEPLPDLLISWLQVLGLLFITSPGLAILPSWHCLLVQPSDLSDCPWQLDYHFHPTEDGEGIKWNWQEWPAGMDVCVCVCVCVCVYVCACLLYSAGVAWISSSHISQSVCTVWVRTFFRWSSLHTVVHGQHQ